MTSITQICPGCHTAGVEIFYEVEHVPTNSVLLLNTLDEAVEFPRGHIALGHCPTCGFIYNTAFDPKLTEYSGRYESTQGYSPTFNKFHRRLAQDLIDRFGLNDKKIIEIGCGSGEFLTLLCEMGPNRGTGFDPAYVPTRHQVDQGHQISFVQDFYSDRYVDHQADFIACKMTLEHIINTADFIGTVRRAIADRLDTVVFFQIPNGRYVFGDLAFWDIYYEHCSYFSHGSLARLFRQECFDVLELWTDYDDQYLMIAARPTAEPTLGTTGKLPQEDDLQEVRAEVERFTVEVPARLAAWRADIDRYVAKGQKVVLWGGGSKGVAFLTTLGITDEIEYAVDINPNKAQTYMAGTGQEIVPPSFLETYRPDVVIIMNPIYRAEITGDLHALGLDPEIRVLD